MHAGTAPGHALELCYLVMEQLRKGGQRSACCVVQWADGRGGSKSSEGNGAPRDQQDSTGAGRQLLVTIAATDASKRGTLLINSPWVVATAQRIRAAAAGAGTAGNEAQLKLQARFDAVLTSAKCMLEKSPLVELDKLNFDAYISHMVEQATKQSGSLSKCVGGQHYSSCSPGFVWEVP